MTQEKAFEILRAGHNVYLTGAAGSGKTYLLNKYIKFLREKGIGVGITASTGIAATHLGGLTIHSWAGIGISRFVSDQDIKKIAANRRIAKRFVNAKTLIIDEISMLDADRLSLVDRVARAARGSWEPFGGMQVIFCGDFFSFLRLLKKASSLLNSLIIPRPGKNWIRKFVILRNNSGRETAIFLRCLMLFASRKLMKR